MKKIVSMMAVAAALLCGVASCDKENGAETSGQPEMGGSVKIAVALPGNATDKVSRAFTTSDLRPKTTWDNISKLMIVFAEADGTSAYTGKSVKGAIEISGANLATLKGGGNLLLTSAPQGTWDVFLIANHPNENAVSVINKPVANVMAKVAEAAAVPVGEASGTKAYGEAAEMFISKISDVIVGATATDITATPFKLVRATSLFRVRIDAKPYTTAGTPTADEAAIEANNAKLDFSGIRIRRVTNAQNIAGMISSDYMNGGTLTAITLPGTYTPSVAAGGESLNKSVFVGGAFLTTAPVDADYTGTVGDFITKTPNWNEFMIYPSGSADPNKTFNILVEATVRTGESYIDVSGATKNAGDLVYFQATVKNAVGPNQILEVLINVKGTAGSIVPPITEFGSLDIKAEVVDWGSIIGAEVEI